MDKVDVPTDLTANVVPTMSLSIGSSTSLGVLEAGFAHEYTASVAALVTSTGGNATLSVTDPSPQSSGHLINGDRTLASPLQIQATNAAQPSSAFQPLGAGPLTILTYPKEIASDPVTVTFKQPIAAAEPLRAGTYSKTLTFTLSTTLP